MPGLSEIWTQKRKMRVEHVYKRDSYKVKK